MEPFLTQERQIRASQVMLVLKNPAGFFAGDVRDMGSISESEDPLEEGLATLSSVLAWRIPMTEEPGSLWYIGSYMNHYKDKLEGEMPLTLQEA